MRERFEKILSNIMSSLKSLEVHIIKQAGLQASINSAKANCQRKNTTALLADLGSITKEVLSSGMERAESDALNLVLLKEKLQYFSVDYAVHHQERELQNRLYQIRGKSLFIRKEIKGNSALVAKIAAFSDGLGQIAEFLRGEIGTKDEAKIINRFSVFSQQLRSIDEDLRDEAGDLLRLNETKEKGKKVNELRGSIASDWNKVMDILAETLEKVYSQRIKPGGVVLRGMSRGIERIEVRG